MFNLKKFVFNPFFENTFVIWDDETKDAAIIDPGCIDASEENVLEKFISKNNLKVNLLINTHCHIDHVAGNSFVKEKYNVKFYAPEEDLFLLNEAPKQAEMFGIDFKPSPEPDEFITEETKLQIGSLLAEFIFTPGHTPGEYCILFKNEKKCITGDVLFFEGIGRTDLWGGDYNVLADSIKNKLYTLPEDYEIFPGHGETSTIQHEKKHNPFINSNS